MNRISLRVWVAVNVTALRYEVGEWSAVRTYTRDRTVSFAARVNGTPAYFPAQFLFGAP